MSTRVLVLITTVIVAIISAAQPLSAVQTATRGLQLSAVELQRADAGDAYTALQKLRPHWLRARGSSRPGGDPQVRVFIDGLPRGGTDVLRSVDTNSILAMSYVPGIEAAGRFGPGHPAGVIIIRTR